MELYAKTEKIASVFLAKNRKSSILESGYMAGS
jgi:hypothetical protein